LIHGHIINSANEDLIYNVPQRDGVGN